MCVVGCLETSAALVVRDARHDIAIVQERVREDNDVRREACKMRKGVRTRDGVRLQVRY